MTFVAAGVSGLNVSETKVNYYAYVYERKIDETREFKSDAVLGCTCTCD